MRCPCADTGLPDLPSLSCVTLPMLWYVPSSSFIYDEDAEVRRGHWTCRGPYSELCVELGPPRPSAVPWCPQRVFWFSGIVLSHLNQVGGWGYITVVLVVMSYISMWAKCFQLMQQCAEWEITRGDRRKESWMCSFINHLLESIPILGRGLGAATTNEPDAYVSTQQLSQNHVFKEHPSFWWSQASRW